MTNLCKMNNTTNEKQLLSQFYILTFNQGRKKLILNTILFLIMVGTVTITYKSFRTFENQFYRTLIETTTEKQSTLIESKRSNTSSVITNYYYIKYAVIRKTFENREEKMKEVCININNDMEVSPVINTVYSNMFIDRLHSISWCPVFKAASSVWMKNFIILSGEWNTKHEKMIDMGYMQINNMARMFYPSQRITEIAHLEIQQSRKLLIVRHPFQRLLSAYRDKLENKENRQYYYLNYGHYIRTRYGYDRKNVTKPEPTFLEFIRFIVNEKYFDEHWKPIYQQCAPCQVKYNYILKFEKFRTENKYLLKELQLDHILRSDIGDKQQIDEMIEDNLIKTYFSQVPIQLLKKIYKIYEFDFLLFGYSPNVYYNISKQTISRNFTTNR